MTIDDIKDLLHWMQYRAEDAWDAHVPELVNSVKKTWKLTVFWTLVLVISSVAYVLLASAEYKTNPDGPISGWFNGFYYIFVIILAIATLGFSFLSARVGFLAGKAALFEAAALPALNLLYSIASAFIPDWLEKKFDSGKLAAKLQKAQEDKSLGKLAEKTIRGYLHAVAWLIFVPWLLLFLPLVVFNQPVTILMAVLAVCILIYQVVGWDTEPFWYGIVQQGAMMTCVAYLAIFFVIKPLSLSTGVFEGFGPEGYARTAFWFVVFVIAAAIVGSGARLNRNNLKGKYSISFSPARCFVAIVILIAAFLFGNLALTSFAEGKYTNPFGKNGSSNTSGSGGNSGGSSSKNVPSGCISAYTYSSGSCWKIIPPKSKGQGVSTDSNFETPSGESSADGKVCTAIVPADSEGVEVECPLKTGEKYSVTVEGTVLFSKDHPRSGPCGLKGWYDPNVEGGHPDNVGGLEFGIGDFSNSFIPCASYTGVAKTSGNPILRVVESNAGRKDGNKGGFKVTIKKL